MGIRDLFWRFDLLQRIVREFWNLMVSIEVNGLCSGGNG